MKITAQLIMMAIACALLFLAAVGWPQTAPVNLGWLGLFLWALAVTIKHAPATP